MTFLRRAVVPLTLLLAKEKETLLGRLSASNSTIRPPFSIKPYTGESRWSFLPKGRAVVPESEDCLMAAPKQSEEEPEATQGAVASFKRA